jgi:hypothetical protein
MPRTCTPLPPVPAAAAAIQNTLSPSLVGVAVNSHTLEVFPVAVTVPMVRSPVLLIEPASKFATGSSKVTVKV